MKRLLMLTTALLLVAGCSKTSEPYSDTRDVKAAAASLMAPAAAPVAPPPAADAEVSRVSSNLEKPPTQLPPAAATPVVVSTPLLAYSYSYALETPANQLRDLIKLHEKACVAAGPAVCQMVGEHVSAVGKDNLEGELSLRATPAWLKVFRDGLEAQAKAAGGRVVSSATSSEDLSRSIVDTEAAIRAKTTLRDRLQALLASHPGKLSDLLEVEQSLAQVQGEIDATQSELAVMRTRVATSALTISYRSGGVLAPQGVWQPLKSAFDDFLGTMVVVIAGIVRFVAVVLPLGLLVAGIVWLVRKPLGGLLRKRKPAGWKPQPSALEDRPPTP